MGNSFQQPQFCFHAGVIIRRLAECKHGTFCLLLREDRATIGRDDQLDRPLVRRYTSKRFRCTKAVARQIDHFEPACRPRKLPRRHHPQPTRTVSRKQRSTGDALRRTPSMANAINGGRTFQRSFRQGARSRHGHWARKIQSTTNVTTSLAFLALDLVKAAIGRMASPAPDARLHPSISVTFESVETGFRGRRQRR
jgi:hypothetical protein